MTKPQFQKLVLKSISNLDFNLLQQLEDDADYHFNDKTDIIINLKFVINNLKAKGIDKLRYIKSECRYCHPEGDTFSFYNTRNDEFVIRYVIHKVADNKYIITPCKNIILTDGPNGEPF